MNIFINNEKLKLKFNSSPLIIVLEYIKQIAFDSGDIIVELKIDGVIVDLKKIPLNKSVDTLEITTRSHEEILIESLYQFNTHFQQFKNNFDTLSNDSIHNYTIFIEMLKFIEWTLNLMVALDKFSSLKFISPDFDDILFEFSNYAKNVFKLFQNDSIEELFEIIERALIPILEKVSDNIRLYLNIMLKESKRHIS